MIAETARDRQLAAYLREPNELDMILADPRCGDCREFEKAFPQGVCEAASEYLRREGFPPVTVHVGEMTKCDGCPCFSAGDKGGYDYGNVVDDAYARKVGK